MLRCFEQIREKRKKQKNRRRRKRGEGNLGRKRKRSCRVNIINKGEVVEGVAGVLLVGDLTWRAESETCSVQAESDSSDTEAPICASQDLQLGPLSLLPARFCDSVSDQ